jgi:hypothetical protein
MEPTCQECGHTRSQVARGRYRRRLWITSNRRGRMNPESEAVTDVSAFAIPSIPEATFKVTLTYGGKFLYVEAYHDKPNPPYRIEGGTLMGAGGGRSEAIPTDLEPTTLPNAAYFTFRTVPGYTFSAFHYTAERPVEPQPDLPPGSPMPPDVARFAAHWLDIDMHNDETGAVTRIVGTSMGGPWDIDAKR